MPHDQGRGNNTKPKVADRRNNATLKRASDKNNVKECQASGLAKRYMEPGWVYWVVSSATPSLQQADQRNHSDSKLQVIKSPTSPLAFTAPGNSPDESRDSVNSTSPASSSGVEIFDQSENSNSVDETLHSPSSISSSNCLISANYSNPVSENFSAGTSNILADNTSKAGKTLKKSSQRKGKKKGKQCNGAESNKVSPKYVVESEQHNNEASVSKASTKKFQSYVERVVLDKNSSNKKQLGPFMVANDQNKSTNAHVDSSKTLISHILCSNKENGSELSTVCERFVGENFSYGNFIYQSNTSGASRDVQIIPSSFTSSIEDAYYNGNSNFQNTSLSSSMGNYSTSSPPFESFHNSSNAEINENFSDGVEMHLTPNEAQPILSSDRELIPGFKRLHIPCRTSAGVCNLNTDIPFDSCIYVSNWPSNSLPSTTEERAACSSQETSSSDSHPVIPGKKGRRSRKITEGGNLNDVSKSRPANKRIHGKENNHFIWQKVEKIDGRSYQSGTDNVISISPRSDDPSGPSHMQVKSDSVVSLKNNNDRRCRYSCSGGSQTYKKEPNELGSNASKSKTLVNSTIGNSISTVKSKVSGLPKWIIPSSRNESNGLLQKPNIFKNDINQNKVLNTSLLVSYKTSTNVSEVTENSCIGPCLSVAEHRISAPREEAKPREFYCMSVSKSLLDPVSQIGLSPPGAGLYVHRHDVDSNNSDLVPCIEMHDLSGPCYEYKPVRQLELSCTTEARILKSTSQTQLQQLTPIERKNSTNSSIFTVNASKLSDMEKDRHHKFDLENVKPGISNFDDNEIAFSCSSSSSKDAECSSNVSVELICKSGSHADLGKNKFGLHTTSECENTMMREKEDLEFDADLDKISQNACEFHTEIDHDQHSSESPASDFEIFLSSASPLLSLSSQDSYFESFSSEQQVACLFCQNKVPNFSLKSLWQWYEEPGCFGLEVKVQENHNPRWLCNSNSEFNAYFVPYLSAVQLFGNSRSGRCCNNAATRTVSPKVDMTSNTSSYLDCQPASVSPSCAHYEFLDQSHKSTDIGQEVIFEYFEYDQPPWRQPLFEKLKELVSGCPSNSRMFGDPKKLEYSNLHDLHQASWYSVAWYPIYRIPDGKFRAAFLTYHSLGQLAHVSKPCSTGAISSVIAPVVGMQTYNDKGESWCQPRSSSKVLRGEAAPCSNPLELISERLRRLQHTASAMSRAVVMKDSKTSVNRHPDFEFFLSRSR